MQKTPPIDLYTLSIFLADDRDLVVQGMLRVVIEIEQVRVLLKYGKCKQPIQNAARYLIGRYLNVRYESFDYIELHVEWAKENLGLEEYQDRRLRRHARSIDEKVAEGMTILEVLKLPALTLRGAKSRKGKAVEQNLDALRNLRGDLQSKIVTK